MPTRGYGALRNCLFLLSLCITAGKHSAKAFELLKKGRWGDQPVSPDLLEETMDLLGKGIDLPWKGRKLMIFPHLKGLGVTRVVLVQL